MLGNDVVDLRDPESRPVSPRFDARVFCDAERRALDASRDRHRQRCRLWAAKEAAYKAVVARHAETIFSPPRFRVDLDEDASSGGVETPAGPVGVRVTERDGAVHAVACDEGSDALFEMTRLDAPGEGATHSAGDAPGLAVRRFATERIARSLALDPSSLEIRKRGRVPELWVEGRRHAALSLSHHGGVVGFACEVTR